jgi:ABC-type transport system substrate-binding protein
MRSKDSLILVCINLFLLVSQVTIFSVTSQETGTIADFFSLTIITPLMGHDKRYGGIFIETLDDIGIGVDFRYISVSELNQRVSYQIGNIDTFIDGGYDILEYTYGITHIFDWFPDRLFHTDSINLLGKNFYQYSNHQLDLAIDEYVNSFYSADRIPAALEIQEILTKEIPTLAIFYPAEFCILQENLTGIDAQLFYTEWDFSSIAKWEIPGQSTFTYGGYDMLRAYNPHVYNQTGVEGLIWLDQIYVGLTERENSTHFWKPLLASDYETNNGYNWTVSLDPNAKWADGTRVTPEDVIFNYNLILNSSYNANDYSFYTEYMDNNSIKKLDNYTLEFSFKKADYLTENCLSLRLLPPQIWENISSPEIIITAKDWLINNPEKIFGAGPFKLQEFNKYGGFVHLVMNQYYNNLSSDGNPYFSDVHFIQSWDFYDMIEGFENGTIDMLDPTYYSPYAPVSRNHQLHRIKLGLTHEFAINNKHPILGTGELCPIAGPLSALHVRKAINHLFPRYALDSYLMSNGSLTSTVYPSSAIGFNETYQPVEYSLELAKNEMILAGYDFTSSPTINLNIPLLILLPQILMVYSFYIYLRNKKKKQD